MQLLTVILISHLLTRLIYFVRYFNFSKFYHVTSTSSLSYVGNLTEIPTCEKQKKIEKTHAKESNQMHKNIYVVRQFAYVHRVAEISLLSGKKKYKGRLQFFSISHKHGNTTFKTLITKVGFYIYKMGPKIFSRGQPRKLVHERSSLGLLAQASAPWNKPQ